ncbi:MAG: c-type cytochrome [Nitrospirae bacterium]|nr:c-type cytochrome [Nitrospirota bacterium]
MSFKRWIGFTPALMMALALFALANPAWAADDDDGLPPGRVAEGEKVFTQRACKGCHSIRHKGGQVGPDLTQLAVRRKPEWIENWLRDPSLVVPGTDMPTFEWESDQELADLIAYLSSLATPVDHRAIVAAAPSPEVAGERLVGAFDCRACHRIGTEGRSRYPDLTRVGAKIYPEWEATWLKDPQAIKPGTFMPTFPMDDRARAAVAAYLHTLR